VGLTGALVAVVTLIEGEAGVLGEPTAVVEDLREGGAEAVVRDGVEGDAHAFGVAFVAVQPPGVVRGEAEFGDAGLP